MTINRLSVDMFILEMDNPSGRTWAIYKEKIVWRKAPNWQGKIVNFCRRHEQIKLIIPVCTPGYKRRELEQKIVMEKLLN